MRKTGQIPSEYRSLEASPSSRCRTASASYKERSKNIEKEISKANEVRLLKEVERPKILIDEHNLDKPKPASFYITKARENFVKKNSPKYSEERVTRKSVFGSLLSSQVFRNSTRSKTFGNTFGQKRMSLKETIDNENILPDWLLERPDYNATVKKLMSTDGNISNICGTLPTNRTEDEKNSLYRWVSSVPFFSKIPPRVTKETCEKLTRQIYNEGDVVIRKGDPGDCMYIIYSGKANVYLEAGVYHGCLASKSVFGEQALDTLKPRTATITAADELIAFRLTKLDYDAILLNVKKLEKYKNSKLLMKIPFFRKWSFLKVQHLSNYLIQKTYAPNEVIYDKGEESDTFYIVKSGEVQIQSYVQLQHINRWPTGGQQWHILKINRKYIVPIANLQKGTFFGESALIEQMPRLGRAISMTETVCLTINKDEFFDIFSVKDLEGLLESKYVTIPKESELQAKLIEEMKTKSLAKQAIHDAMEVDFQYPGGRESLLDNKTKKLKYWIFDLKKREKNSSKQFKKRIVAEDKKKIDVDSIVMLNSYVADLKKET